MTQNNTEPTWSEKVNESPWAVEGGGNVECTDCPLLFAKDHPRIPLKSEVTGQCPHCALQSGTDHEDNTKSPDRREMCRWCYLPPGSCECTQPDYGMMQVCHSCQQWRDVDDIAETDGDEQRCTVCTARD